MINRSVLVGRLTKDPELRYTQSNKAVAKFTLAVNDKYNKEHTDFIQCVVWDKQAENLVKYVHKGSLVGVEGRIQTGSYDNDQGVRIYTTEVVCDSVQFLEPKKQEQSFNNQLHNEIENKQKESPRLDDINEDDLPF
jgi:single-strand DNA-binding protein